jgi:hypothetical protein
MHEFALMFIRIDIVRTGTSRMTSGFERSTREGPILEGIEEGSVSDGHFEERDRIG